MSKTASERSAAIQQRYRETAVRLYGKYARVKINLPVILLAGFFGTALFVRAAFDKTTPVGAATTFCVLLAGSAAYSIGLDREIKRTIEKETAAQEDERP